MEIYITETGKVVTEQEFRSMYLHVSFPPQLTEHLINQFGGEVVFEGPQAVVTPPYQYSQRLGVEQINGKWFTKYIAGPLFTTFTGENGALVTAAEQEAAYKATKDVEQAKAIREQRGKKLLDCDWTQVDDAPVDKLVWATYRQALRDVTAQTGFPWEVVWPVQPE